MESVYLLIKEQSCLKKCPKRTHLFPSPTYVESLHEKYFQNYETTGQVDNYATIFTWKKKLCTCML